MYKEGKIVRDSVCAIRAICMGPHTARYLVSCTVVVVAVAVV